MIFGHTRRVRVIVLLGLVGCIGDDLPPPRIGGITPDHAPAGAIVTIEGDHFCQQPDAEEPDPLACETMGAVVFGATTATTAQYRDTEILVEVPSLQGTVDVTVQVAGRVSNATSFTIE